MCRHDSLVGYGLSCLRLTEADMDTVREWRNDPEVARWMAYQDVITANMQKAWFRRINNNRDFYYRIDTPKGSVGVVNIKDIDIDKRRGEWGIYIADPANRDGLIAVSTACLILDFAFDTLNLETVCAHIRRDNFHAARFNLKLGFILQSGQDTELNQLYHLTRNDYEMKKDSLRKRLVQRASTNQKESS